MWNYSINYFIEEVVGHVQYLWVNDSLVDLFVGATVYENSFVYLQKSDQEKKKKEAEELNQLFKPVSTKLSKGLYTVYATNSKI